MMNHMVRGTVTAQKVVYGLWTIFTHELHMITL